MGGNGERYDPESIILCKRNSKSRKIGKEDRGERTKVVWICGGNGRKLHTEKDGKDTRNEREWKTEQVESCMQNSHGTCAFGSGKANRRCRLHQTPCE